MEIRNQFANAVNSAVSDPQTYRAIFKDDATVKTESSMYTIPAKVDSICKPAFDVYKSNKVQVVLNTVDVSTINMGFQTIRLTTIETDTSHGVPITNHSPAPKHMEMNIEWILEDNVWLIRNVNRYLTR